MKAFITIDDPETSFNSFFEEAVHKKAFSRITTAMEIISKNEQNFHPTVARFACELQAEPFCQVARFYPHYALLKRFKEERGSSGHTRHTKDLTPYKNVDHAKIIELKKKTTRQNELLSAIKRLDANLETQIQGISSYFRGIASFD